MTVTDAILLEVAEAKQAQLRQWQRGIQLEATTDRTLDGLREMVTVDRWRLAADLALRADRMLRARPPMYRDAVSRYYYAMYHAARALAYFHHEGDDHQEHRVLPGKLPTDFRDHEIWSNNLKNARDTRNRADYEAYPRDRDQWIVDARSLRDQSYELLDRVRTYLAARGCNIDA
jgi:uncharacterized protein (UPF0332 family)